MNYTVVLCDFPVFYQGIDLCLDGFMGGYDALMLELDMEDTFGFPVVPLV
jgi:hypothetical protein